MNVAEDDGASTCSSPASPPASFATDAAMRWLAAINDSEMSESDDTLASSAQQELPLGCNVPTATARRSYSQQEHVRRKHDLSEDGSASSDATPCVAKKRAKRKHRKSTIDSRKEEIAKLLKEMAVLHSRMEDLNARAMAPCAPDETPSEAVIVNKVLRRAIRKQQLEVTRLHALMSEYSLFSIRVGSPIHRPIHLQRDNRSRYTMLTAMKAEALQMGAQFIHDRWPHVDPCKPMREDHGFEAPNGDFYATYFSATQFDNNVKKVFDILLGYFSSIEICVSEKLGNVTIREDDDNLAPGVTQNRLVSTTIGGLRMESNTVYFSHYEDGGDEVGHEHGYGIFVANFVDEDERSPYHPYERIRRDFSAVLELTSYPMKQRTGGTSVVADAERTDEGTVVVLTRWVHSKVHHPEYDIPLSGWHEMRQNTERWIQTLHHTMLERYFAMI